MSSNAPAVQRPRSLFPDLAEVFAGFPWTGLRPVFDTNLLRLEDELKDDSYEVRAEIPGVDPEKDIEVTIADGRLTIKAERTEKSQTNGRSEFNYGSFTRTVTLPRGADPEGVKASYDKGILTVSVPISKPADDAKRIPVTAKQ
ncbi:Hsp20/alpha crystallin family protein [uncultured Mycolicibacterium sp.]|mgnify:CR=1 FL=1|uniref:Hsp20/alpha crystallin family protein n=1 Tax=uncultured Mycolicibacterium sp. TaxID=2320817 RepID=UPI002621A158|nr:Hsp20/alpha crystallin family protein [uncultured Mycolicibacterium sp.]